MSVTRAVNLGLAPKRERERERGRARQRDKETQRERSSCKVQRVVVSQRQSQLRDALSITCEPRSPYSPPSEHDVGGANEEFQSLGVGMCRL